MQYIVYDKKLFRFAKNWELHFFLAFADNYQIFPYTYINRHSWMGNEFFPIFSHQIIPWGAEPLWTLWNSFTYFTYFGSTGSSEIRICAKSFLTHATFASMHFTYCILNYPKFLFLGIPDKSTDYLLTVRSYFKREECMK